MKKWFESFWNTHGERLVFAAMALVLSGVLHMLKLHEQGNTIIIGIAMLMFNKTRGTNGKPKGE